MKKKLFTIMVGIMFVFAMIGPDLCRHSISAAAAAEMFLL